MEAGRQFEDISYDDNHRGIAHPTRAGRLLLRVTMQVGAARSQAWPTVQQPLRPTLLIQPAAERPPNRRMTIPP